MLARTAALTALASAALVAPASAQTSIAVFQMPSRSIHCAFNTAVGSTSQLRCDVDYNTRFRTKPRGCIGDYGRSFQLTPRGRGRAICVTDSVNMSSAPILRYGTSRRFESITCRSRTSGLRCTNTRGHGFFLSRSRQLVF
jgi:hypothetical protein